MSEQELKAVMLSALLVKIITIAGTEKDVFFQQMNANAWSMLDNAKVYIKGDTFDGQDVSSKFEVNDEKGAVSK